MEDLEMIRKQLYQTPYKQTTIPGKTYKIYLLCDTDYLLYDKIHLFHGFSVNLDR